MTRRRILSGLDERAHAPAQDLLDLLDDAATGALAITLSGSISKETADALSDLDFRVYTEKEWTPDADWDSSWDRAREHWAGRGVVLDELWFRTFAEVDASIDAWMAGDVAPDAMIWTIWGYYPLTDLSRQLAVVDDAGVVERWRSRLDPYPDAVRAALVDRHTAPLRYWRGDYHYRVKAHRGDTVFVSALAGKLVHHLLQTLGALNGAYYPGDGNNLRFADALSIAPDRLSERIEAILVAGHHDPARQRDEVCALIDETLELVDLGASTNTRRKD